MLPPLNSDMTITGPGSNNLTISGASNVRIFYAKSGMITINDVTLANGMARGGSGSLGGGGGMGAGGALLMHEGITGNLDLNMNNVIFDNNQAIGGSGAAGLGGGGGGLGGNGGTGASNHSGGGGGFLGNGGAGNNDAGGGGGGFFMDGAPGASNGNGGDGGGGGRPAGLGGNSTFPGENNGGNGSASGDGGDGGFGGGGGGTQTGDDDGNGGNGGFGGGGGGAAKTEDDAQGGNGGFGGGGGSSVESDDADGGSGGFGGGGGAGEDNSGPGGFGGGTADDDSNGGGGMGAGGAIFVVSGKITLANVLFNNNSTTRGTGTDANNGQSLGGAIFIYDHATHGAVNGKSNAEVIVSAGCGITFTNNAAQDNLTTGFVGDGTTQNNDDNVFGLITGALAGNSAACNTLVAQIMNQPPIPSLSFWGLIIFTFLLVSFSLVFLLNVNYQTALSNQSGWTISEQITLPYEKQGLLKALEKTAVWIVLIGAVVFFLWGTLIVDDIIGLSLLTPVLMYFLYLIDLFKEATKK